MSTQLELRGAIPANLLPFDETYGIDEAQYRRHLTWLADVRGVHTIVVNGHAAEVTSLTSEERRRALAIALDEVGTRVNVISGIFSDSTFEAAAMACAAKEEGASGILVAPPSLFAWGANLRPEMAYGHFARIADATDLPIVIFEYPPSQGWGYTPEVLLKLIEIDRVIGIKEWSLDILTFERNLRAIRASGRPVAVMSSFTNSLFASYALGADGSISGMGSVAVDLQVQLFDAVQRGDLAQARALHERHVILTDVFYAPPFVDAHNRMKAALALLRRIDRAIVRPPLQPISAAERERIRRAVAEAGLPTDERVLASV